MVVVEFFEYSHLVGLGLVLDGLVQEESKDVFFLEQLGNQGLWDARVLDIELAHEVMQVQVFGQLESSQLHLHASQEGEERLQLLFVPVREVLSLVVFHNVSH